MPFVLLCVGLRSMKIRWNWVKFLNSGMTKWRRKTDLGPASLVKVRINPPCIAFMLKTMNGIDILIKNFEVFGTS